MKLPPKRNTDLKLLLVCPPYIHVQCPNHEGHRYWHLVNIIERKIKKYLSLCTKFVSPLEILNRWVIQALLLVDSAKTQYTRDDEGPYFCVHLDQHK